MDAFHPTMGPTLSQWLREYRAGKLSFTSFTHSALTHFKLELKSVSRWFTATYSLLKKF